MTSEPRPGRKRRAGWRFALLVLLPLGPAGCGRPHVKGTLAVDTILKAWTSDGFDTQPVVNVEPDLWNAGACSRGEVRGLDILICEYEGDEGLAAGDSKILRDWTEQSAVTGAAVRSSRTILAITDPGQADPDGRTIARLIKTFRSQR